MVSEDGRKDTEEKIEKQEINFDCKSMDKRTRKVMLHLIEKEKKFLGKMPKVIVEKSLYDLEELGEKIKNCDFPTEKTGKKKTEKNGKEKTEKKLSQYQEFMGDCLKDGNEFSDCVANWNFQKDQKAIEAQIKEDEETRQEKTPQEEEETSEENYQN